jgi:type IV secretory pathway TraG/TraD family ATPase VirD4
LRLDPDREHVNYWMSPAELFKHRNEPGKIILGKLAGTYLGHLDDRAQVLIAGARAGKTKTVLEPNLFLYNGSMLVMDPKGELAQTARFRRATGHDVYVLDPFGQSGEPCPISTRWPNSKSTASTRSTTSWLAEVVAR